MNWAISANNNGKARNEIMWDLMEKYGLQLLNIGCLQEIPGNTLNKNEQLRNNLNRVDEALNRCIIVYRRITGGLHPAPDLWIEKTVMQPVFWRIRVFYAVCAASLNIFGVDTACNK